MRFVLVATALLLPAAASAQITPGKWAITATVTSMDMPDVPPFVANMMKKPRTLSQCITAEQAKQGPQEMLKRDKSCRFNRYSMAGGKLDAQMVCNQGGGTMTINSRGTYTPTSFQSSADMVGTGAQAMKMTVVSQGKLVGACK